MCHCNYVFNLFDSGVVTFVNDFVRNHFTSG